MGKTLLLTGHPQSGKTTIIRKVVEELGDLAGGFYTEEIFGPGGRKGFLLITLEGQKAVLAHKDIQASPAYRIGRYGVDMHVLEAVGVAALQQALKTKKVVVIDEIGKMELLSPAFRETVLQAILGPCIILGTILYKPHPHADLFKTLAQVTLREVNPQTRDSLPQELLAEIRKTLPR